MQPQGEIIAGSISQQSVQPIHGQSGPFGMPSWMGMGRMPIGGMPMMHPMMHPMMSPMVPPMTQHPQQPFVMQQNQVNR